MLRIVSSLVAVAVTSLGGVYLVSPPGRTAINLALGRLGSDQWTAEDIAKHPELHLKFVDQKLRDSGQEAIGLLIAGTTRLNTLRRDEASLLVGIDNRTRLIGELSAAQAKCEWPATVRARELTKAGAELLHAEANASVELMRQRLVEVRSHRREAEKTITEALAMKERVKSEQMAVARSSEQFQLRGNRELLTKLDLSGLRDRLNTLHDQSAAAVAVLSNEASANAPSPSPHLNEMLGE